MLTFYPLTSVDCIEDFRALKMFPIHLTCNNVTEAPVWGAGEQTTLTNDLINGFLTGGALVRAIFLLIASLMWRLP
ncbi:hypothetical protein Bpfe_020996 [Biomphalaria pfeifferi]|uniref:Uncharacterized protein n=1 Tax=Biomphalaria pfeifferi TaxID=112525 RepID=A0AAD8F4D3_BIOPF|nr:hypothetical protein Bpfe_020996 [Biomphalaria pfeifferi]